VGKKKDGRKQTPIMFRRDDRQQNNNGGGRGQGRYVKKKTDKEGGERGQYLRSIEGENVEKRTDDTDVEFVPGTQMKISGVSHTREAIPQILRRPSAEKQDDMKRSTEEKVGCKRDHPRFGR